MTVILTLQHVPPSLNTMFRNVAKVGRVKTARYKTWLQAVGWDMKKYHNIRFDEPVIITILIGKLPTSADIDNRTKAILDLLVTYQIIPGDSIKHVRGVNIAVSPVAFEGVQIAIAPALARAA